MQGCVISFFMFSVERAGNIMFQRQPPTIHILRSSDIAQATSRGGNFFGIFMVLVGDLPILNSQTFAFSCPCFVAIEEATGAFSFSNNLLQEIAGSHLLQGFRGRSTSRHCDLCWY